MTHLLKRRRTKNNDGDLRRPWGYPNGKDWGEILLTELKVSSVSGEPTISRAVPIKLNSSDVSIDWSGVSSKADLLVQDQYGNTLDYYFESFDADSEEAVIWVYRDWVRDDSIQLQILEGRGDEASASTVFDKEANLEAGYLFNETSGDLLDVTSNNNDGSLNGGVTQGENGIVNGAYSFDGDDDHVDTNIDSGDLSSDISFSFWFKPSIIDKIALISAYGDGDDTNRWDIQLDRDGDGKVGWVEHESELYLASTTSFSSGHEAFITVTRNSSNSEIKLYVNGDEENSDSFEQGLGTGANVLIGEGDGDNYEGIFDNTFFHYTILSSSEITAIYDATKEYPNFFEQV